MTPGMQWGQILGQMGGTIARAGSQGAAAGTAAKEADIKQKQQDMLAQQNQDQEVQHAQEQGARFIGPGNMIQDSMLAPDGSQIVTHRPPNSDELVTSYPGRKGTQPVKMAWPSMHQQIM